MDIFSFITLFGGLAFFLYGMKVMSDGLEKSANGKLSKSFKKFTDNRILAMLFGAGITFAVQSSSAVTVMLVGLVNSGIIEFNQTIGMLMGANIGKTFTSWISSLAGIDSDVVWINMLKPAYISLIFAVAGIIMVMMKKPKLQGIGNAFIGFAILMFGMHLMSSAMEPLSEMPEFTELLTAFENPLLAVLVGAIFTGIIQSSAASVGILQAMSMTGGVTYGMAIPIIMGQNIGTCITALISSIGVNRKAKKVAVMHLAINILGTLIFMIPFYICTAVFDMPFMRETISPFMIAVVHSIFNILTTLVLLPFCKQLEQLANKIIPDSKDSDQPTVILDDRLLTVPSMAVKKSLDVALYMCSRAKKAFLGAIEQINDFDAEKANEITDIEVELDRYKDQLATYMTKLYKISIAEEDLKTVTKILHTIDDFERIGDHALYITNVGRQLYDKEMTFSDDAFKELEKLTSAAQEILTMTSTAFKTNDFELASSVEPLRRVISKLIRKIKNNHVQRLQTGDCTTDLGFMLSDILTSCERVAGHCSNIAVAVIEINYSSFAAHEYLEEVKTEDDYTRKYKEYSAQFSLEQ
ncbi:MAG: Na/Pi cotransporter family protein [Eubacterium sp.]|nr:Na/Pi cotransporter family protein [Eubacterium sp.]